MPPHELLLRIDILLAGLKVRPINHRKTRARKWAREDMGNGNKRLKVYSASDCAGCEGHSMAGKNKEEAHNIGLRRWLALCRALASIWGVDRKGKGDIQPFCDRIHRNLATAFGIY